MERERLPDGRDAGSSRCGGCHRGGATVWVSTIAAWKTVGLVIGKRAPETKIGAVHGFDPGLEWGWHGGRSEEDRSQGVTAQRATHCTLASTASRSAPATASFRQRIPAVRIQQTIQAGLPADSLHAGDAIERSFPELDVRSPSVRRGLRHSAPPCPRRLPGRGKPRRHESPYARPAAFRNSSSTASRSVRRRAVSRHVLRSQARETEFHARQRPTWRAETKGPELNELGEPDPPAELPILIP